MTTTSTQAWRAISAALLLGVLADLLLRPMPWSLGLLLWVAAALALGFTLRPDARAAAAWPALGCLAAAAMMVVRASDDLWVFNLVALLAGLAVLLYRVRGGRVTDTTPEEGVGALIGTLLTCLFGPFLLATRDVDWAGERSTGRRVAIGALLAAPLVVVLGALLAGAEPVFGSLLRSLLDLPHFFSHLLLVGWFGWITAGYLRALAVRPEDRWRPGRGPGIGDVEALTVLGALAVLFAVFLVVEARAIAGGAELVRSVTGLTYASYARRGFLELVVAAGITLATLVALDWARAGAATAGDRRVRGLAWVLLALLGLLIASAFARLALYVSYYGLSATRAYAAMAIAWVAVAAGWFGVTVLRGRRGRFVFGAMAAAVLWLAAADLGNVEALVVRFNVARAQAGQTFDGEYLGALSADAVPAVVAALPAIPDSARCAVVSGVIRRAQRSWGREPGWQGWNFGVQRAVQAVARADLGRVAAACSPPSPRADSLR
jgi:hypothetical protein